MEGLGLEIKVVHLGSGKRRTQTFRISRHALPAVPAVCGSPFNPHCRSSLRGWMKTPRVASSGMCRGCSHHGFLARGWCGQREQRCAWRVQPSFVHASWCPVCAGQPQGRRSISGLEMGTSLLMAIRLQSLLVPSIPWGVSEHDESCGLREHNSGVKKQPK